VLGWDEWRKRISSASPKTNRAIPAVPLSFHGPHWRTGRRGYLVYQGPSRALALVKTEHDRCIRPHMPAVKHRPRESRSEREWTWSSLPVVGFQSSVTVHTATLFLTTEF